MTRPILAVGSAASACVTAVHVHGAGDAEEEKKAETVSSAFVGDLEAAVKLFVEKWQDHPEGANALAQKHEPDLVRLELRPLVFEEVRLQVDEEMRVLLENLKVSLCKPDDLQTAENPFAVVKGLLPWSGFCYHTAIFLPVDAVWAVLCCFVLC